MPVSPQQSQKGASETGDITQLIDQALSGVNLRSDQKQTLQATGADVDTKVAAVDQAKRDLLRAMADEIEAGKIDEGALHSKTEKFADAATAASPAVRKAFQTLHDTLDPQQRKQFVDAFRSATSQGAAMGDPHATLEKWSMALNLTDEEKQKIGQILSSSASGPSTVRQRVDKVLDAFASDQFKIDDVLPIGNEHERAEAVAKNMQDVASKVTDVLTPEQRRIAAEKIRERLSGQPTQQIAGGIGLTTPDLEGVDTTSEGLWMGRGGFGYAAGYRRTSGFAFGGGYRAGWGGGFLI
jgi:Spy/CpxP family protein refolding chaperone